jgi:hypothetical protein
LTFIKLMRFLVAALSIALPQGVYAQSVLERTPNLHDGWTGEFVQFNFVHRMFFQEIQDENRLLASPVFLLSVPIRRIFMLGIQYASRSEVVQSNEFELFGRWRLLTAEEWFPFGVALSGAFNTAAQSPDGELALNWPLGRFRLLGMSRALTRAYETNNFRVAFGGGLVVTLNRSIALAGDIISLANRADDEKVAWGLGFQLRVPDSPHTFSLQLSNAQTTTIQGSSRGEGIRTWGFEFTTPMTFLGRGI